MKCEKTPRYGRAVFGRILATMLLAGCISGSLPQTAFAADGDTDADLYGCSPVEQDLSGIPAMENRVYAEWEGSIYYRQYSDEDLEDGALWGEFEPVPGTAKELMCMKPDGSVTQVGTDYGDGDLFIVGGRIYSQKYVQTREDGRQITRAVVYSCELNGSDVKEYSARRIFAVKGDRIVCGTGGYAGDDGYGITWIDGRNGEEHVLVSGKGLYHGAEYLGATEEAVYLSKLVRHEKEEYEQPYDLTLYAVDYKGNTKDLATITMQEYAKDCVAEDFLSSVMESPLFIPYFQILGEELYFAVGTTNGTADVYSGGMIYRVKKDGSGLTRLVDHSPAKRFYLYDDGANRILFCRLPDQRTGFWKDDMQQIILRGKTVDEIAVRDADQTYFDRPHSYTAGGADTILFYPDTSGVCYQLLTEKESEALGIRTYVDGHMVQQTTDIEYLGGKLFFTVTELTYSQEYSIGWRDGYERGRSVCYCKDMASGKIRALYRYGTAMKKNPE